MIPSFKKGSKACYIGNSDVYISKYCPPELNFVIALTSLPLRGGGGRARTLRRQLLARLPARSKRSSGSPARGESLNDIRFLGVKWEFPLLKKNI